MTAWPGIPTGWALFITALTAVGGGMRTAGSRSRAARRCGAAGWAVLAVLALDALDAWLLDGGAARVGVAVLLLAYALRWAGGEDAPLTAVVASALLLLVVPLPLVYALDHWPGRHPAQVLLLGTANGLFVLAWITAVVHARRHPAPPPAPEAAPAAAEPVDRWADIHRRLDSDEAQEGADKYTRE